MNEEIDESEFYHQDFTTASEWEIFIARIEEVIREWRMESLKPKPDSETLKEGWEMKTENIPFADAEFTITLFKKCGGDRISDDDKSVLNNEYDFVLKNGRLKFPELCISTWYGLEEYIVLSPVGAGITSESKIKLLLSSINIVVGNENLTIPIFVQIRDKWQNSYLGHHETDSIRTDFSCIHLRRGPQHAQYLTGLLDIFRTKIMSPTSLDPVIVSVQLKYTLTDFGNFVWRQEMPDTDNEHFDSSTLCVLPFGVTIDPVSTLTLKATWSHLPEHLVVDSESYTDFNPLEAQKWSIYSTMTDQPLCLLSDCFSDFLQLLGNNLTIYDILGDFAAAPATEGNPLDLLTEPKVPTISSVLKRAARNSLTKSRRGIAPLSEDVLVPMLYYLFPDADDNTLFPYIDGAKEETEVCLCLSSVSV